ncbi:translational machinery component [Hypomontagnella monticulosa]|nr:translational machinery component [Hypomontagnella monticulosa]
MSRPSSRLLAVTRTRIPSQSTPQCVRQFSHTLRQAEPPRQTSLLDGLNNKRRTAQPAAPPQPSDGDNSGIQQLHRILLNDTLGRARNLPTINDILRDENGKEREDWGPATEPFHFHIYSHKHNAHITVTKPNRGAIISKSTGDIGFKKAKRGSYDAAYQLTAYVIDKLHQGNWHKNITQMEVVLRGFGNGREAATKVLLGTEGRMLRDKIVKVSDASRLKFGGTRSPKPRRLG